MRGAMADKEASVTRMASTAVPLELAMSMLSLASLLSNVLSLVLVFLGAPFSAAAPVARIGAGDWAIFSIVAAAAPTSPLAPRGG